MEKTKNIEKKKPSMVSNQAFEDHIITLSKGYIPTHAIVIFVALRTKPSPMTFLDNI